MNLQPLLFKCLPAMLGLLLMIGLSGCVYYPYPKGYLGFYGGDKHYSLSLRYSYPYPHYRHRYYFKHYPRFKHPYRRGYRYKFHPRYGRHFHGYRGHHH